MAVGAKSSTEYRKRLDLGACRNRFRKTEALVVVALAAALACAPEGTGGSEGGDEGHTWLVAAGPRLGPVGSGTSEDELLRRFGEDALRREPIELGEGFVEPGTILFPADPQGRLEIVWADTLARDRPARAWIREGAERWRTAEGLGIGTTLEEIEAANGGPFRLAGFGWDYGGTVTSWEGGALSRLESEGGRILVRLGPEAQVGGEFRPVLGDHEVASDHALMRRAAPRIREIVAIWEPSSRAGAGAAPIDTSYDDLFPTWSPDGSRIAFVSTRDGDPEIYVMDAEGRNPRRLTRAPGRDAHPAWSPDGRRIVFQSPREGEHASDVDLYVMDADGGGLRALTGGPHFDGVPVWGPDGRTILFQRREAPTADGYEDGNWQIHRIDAGGGGLRRLVPSRADDQVPNWAPDGRRFVFFSDRSGTNRLYVADLEGGEPRRLAGSGGEDTGAAWSPDGGEIAFVGSREGVSGLYRANADGSGARALGVEARFTVPFWSPDGERILFGSRRDGAWRIYLVRPDGSGLRRLEAR